MQLHDGAMGTMLAAHLRGGETVDDLCVRAPELVRAVHADYVTAGADVIQTNSFLVGLRDSTRRRRLLLDAAMDCGRSAIESSGRAQEVELAGTIGPHGSEPRAYWDELEYWLEHGLTRVRVETVGAATTADAVTQAWNDVARGSDAQLLLGCTVSPGAGYDACRWVAEVAASAPTNVGLGLNCCEGPAGLRSILELIVEERGPDTIWVDPSAGLPPHQSAGEWAERMAELIDGIPLRAVGGCCGTTPQHIADLRETMEI